MKLTDQSPMPFGKFKGKPMEEVPASYLLWCIDCYKDRTRTPWQEAIYQYALDNLDVLKKEVLEGKSISRGNFKADRIGVIILLLFGLFTTSLSGQNDFRAHRIELIKKEIQLFDISQDELFDIPEGQYGLGEYLVTDVGKYHKGYYFHALSPRDLKVLNADWDRDYFTYYTCDNDCLIKGPFLRPVVIKEYFPVQLKVGDVVRLDASIQLKDQE